MEPLPKPSSRGCCLALRRCQRRDGRRAGRRRSLQRRLLRRLGRGVVGRDVGCGGGYREHRAQSACLAFRWKSSALRPSACVTRGAQGGGIMIGAAGACDGSAGSKYSLVSSAAEAPRCSCAAASSPTKPRVLGSLRPSARRGPPRPRPRAGPSLRRRSGGRVAPLRRAAAEAAFSALADALAAAHAAAHAAALAAVQARESARGLLGGCASGAGGPGAAAAATSRTPGRPRSAADGRGAPLRADVRRADRRTARRAAKRRRRSAARWRAGRVEAAWRALLAPSAEGDGGERALRAHTAPAPLVQRRRLRPDCRRTERGAARAARALRVRRPRCGLYLLCCA